MADLVDQRNVVLRYVGNPLPTTIANPDRSATGLPGIGLWCHLDVSPPGRAFDYANNGDFQSGMTEGFPVDAFG